MGTFRAWIGATALGALCLGAALAASVTGAGATEPDGPLPAHGLALPASFAGVLPCADCPGIRHHLDLWADQSFHLEREYLERGPAFGATGHWHYDPTARAVVLVPGSGETLAFQVTGETGLRLLDRERQPIDSDQPLALTGDGSLTPAEIAVRMRGMMVYFADAARLTDCASGRSYPMALERAFAEVERAYLAAVPAPAEPLMVEIEAQIAMRPGMDDLPPAPTVIPEALVAVEPGETCAERPAPELVNTVWRLVVLAGETVEPVADRTEPHLVLLSDGQSYAATAGCNRLLGGVETGDGSIDFGQGMSTLMACPPPLDRLEFGLSEVLSEAAGWRIEGDRLTLTDADDAVLAEFRAVWTP